MLHRPVRHHVEYVSARLLLGAVKRLGPSAASGATGRLAVLIGPHLPVSAVAARNLATVLPVLPESRRARILRAMCDNLGRTVAELPHLAALRETPSGPGYEIVGAAHLLAPPAHAGATIYVSAHYGNWELLPKILADRSAAFAPVYRRAGNPGVDRAIRALRAGTDGSMPAFAKGTVGARAAAIHLARGGRLGLLVDQKLNEGIKVPFLGRLAMATPFPAQLALRYRCPVIPGRVDWPSPLCFRLTVDAPLPDSGDAERDVRMLTWTINQVVGSWIRTRPDHWLWLYRRWPEQPRPAAAPARAWAARRTPAG